MLHQYEVNIIIANSSKIANTLIIQWKKINYISIHALRFLIIRQPSKRKRLLSSSHFLPIIQKITKEIH